MRRQGSLGGAGRWPAIWQAIVLVLCPAIPLLCQSAPEQPVGLVLASQSARLSRGDTLLPLAAKPGDILFSGDSLAGGASFLYCPENSSQTLSPDGAVVF